MMVLDWRGPISNNRKVSSVNLDVSIVEQSGV